MSQIGATDPGRVEQTVEALNALALLRKERPSVFYEPHDKGQEQFHRSLHDYRVMFPGNRWGKTTAMGAEANWWITKTHRFQPTPSGFVIVLWICTQFRQYEILKSQLESEVFDRGWSWNGQDNMYTWPDQGQLWVVPGDRDSFYLQGINPDLVLCDEEPPPKLWRELQSRRFGRRDGRTVRTRYCIAATATEGESWMEQELMAPWLEHHRSEGLNDRQAVVAQTHPSIWCWPFGGIADNPHATKADYEHQKSIGWRSEAERGVRLHGGFAAIGGTYVFDRGGVDWIKAQTVLADQNIGAGRTGSLRATGIGADRLA